LLGQWVIEVTTKGDRDLAWEFTHLAGVRFLNSVF
jgi:hypothetical protein